MAHLQAILRAFPVLVIEIGVAALLLGVGYVTMMWILRRPASDRALSSEGRGRTEATVRRILGTTFVALAVVIIGYNGWLLAQSVDVLRHTIGILRSLSVDIWRVFAVALGKVILTAFGILVAASVIRRLLGGLHAFLSHHRRFRDKSRNLDQLFTSLDRIIGLTGWLLVLVLASWLLALPQILTGALLLVMRLYLVLAVGIAVVRSAPVVIDFVEDQVREHMQARGWGGHYSHLRRLLPTLRTCVEYALWITVAALVIVQLEPTRNLASWGPRLVEAVAIFFIGRVIIEIGHVEIGHRMLPPEGLDEMEQRRRATMVPLVRSMFTYAAYFATAALMLSVLGFNPMPFLAGAGILGLVVGFGAQSLINDVVSGFFILFENVYLVGDLIESSGARGVVEAIEFRVTKIRDADGRVHIIRNGDMKPVINYSKDYAMAVVSVEIPYDRDLRAVFGTLLEAGGRVRAGDANVLAETRIDGITNFGGSTMTVRTSTRVRPGCHEATAAALRLAIKEEFDRQGTSDTPRVSLVPERLRRAEMSRVS